MHGLDYVHDHRTRDTNEDVRVVHKPLADAFKTAKRGTALALVRQSDWDVEAPPKPARLATRVDQGGFIDRSHMATICERASRKRYVAIDVTSIFKERDWESCS